MTKIKKIIMYHDHPKSVCSFWRGNGPFSELHRQGIVNITESNWDESWHDLRKYHIAFFQRPMDVDTNYKVLLAKDMNIKIWVDLDDWMYLHPDHPVYEVYKNNFNERKFKQVLKAADVITVTNEYMKKSFSEFLPSISEKIQIIPNAVNDNIYIQKEKSLNNYVLFRGGSHHEHDIKYFIDEIVRITRTHHREWTLLSIGSKLKEARMLINYAYQKGLNIHQYFGFIMNLRPAIIVVPLIEDRFNKCKSDIAFQEAALIGGQSIMPEWSNHGGSITYDKNNFGEVFNNALNRVNWISKEKQQEHYKKLSEINKLRIKILNEL